MKRVAELSKEKQSIATMVELSSAFEGIASVRIAKIKDQVLQSTEFFNDLWNIYTQLRVDRLFRSGRGEDRQYVIDKELYIIITAEGGFSGDIDQKLISWMLKSYDPAKNDIVVVGHHGAIQLAQKGISFVKYYKLPEKDQNINVTPIIRYVQKYKKSSVYYQEYVSLSVQDVKRIELSKAVTEQGSKAEKTKEIISEDNYIFEPSVYDVVGHLERSMLQIALSQLILNSKLAQFASRFNAMSMAHQNANRSLEDITLHYNRSLRAAKDERLKEIINGLRKAKAV
jgi:F-type H+-transporting ATPase subunit gamma